MDYQARFGWPKPLSHRYGGFNRLRGLLVLYDFRWRKVFGHDTGQFTGGQALADELKTLCPSGKRPALLLTDDDSATQGYIEIDDELWVVVLRIREYLAAPLNPAKSYLAGLRMEVPLRSSAGRATQVGAEQLRRQLPKLKLSEVVEALSDDPGTRTDLAEKIAQLDGINHVVSGREREAVVTAIDNLGDQVWSILAEEGPQLPLKLAEARVWQHRRDALDEFDRELTAKAWSESEWQTFFEREPWIFGFGLECQFLHLIEGQPYVGGKNFRNRDGLFSDYLMGAGAGLRFTMLVEIKTPQAPLLELKGYREGGVFAPGKDVAGGTAQIQKQVSLWTHTSHEAANEPLVASRTYTHQPRGVLLVGDLGQFLTEGAVDSERLLAFESYRRNLTLPEILCFDELLERARQMLGGLTNSA